MTVEIILGAAAIVLTVVLFWRHDKDIKAVKRNVKEVTDQIPTRYIAKFPYNFIEIIKLIKEAKRSIKIVSDLPGYGCFSSPHSYWEYRDYLQKQVGGVNITLIVYDKNQIVNSITEQFINADSNLYLSESAKEFYKKLGENSSRLEKDFKNTWASKLLNGDIKSNNELLKLIAEFQQAEIKVFTGWEIQVEEKKFPNEVFYWLVDDCEAIFSILNESLVDSEASFYTRDRNFIELLNENFRKKLAKINNNIH